MYVKQCYLLIAVLTVTQQVSLTAQGDTETQSKCGCFSGVHIAIFNYTFICVYCLLAAPPSITPLVPERGVEAHGRTQQEERFGGYDCDFVEQPPSAFPTECPICRLVLRDPYQCEWCGKNFCHSCSKRIQAEQKPCPMCKEANFKVFQDNGLKHSLNQLHVFCTHSKDGCKWKGELGELERHMIEGTHFGELFPDTDRTVWESFCC